MKVCCGRAGGVDLICIQTNIFILRLTKLCKPDLQNKKKITVYVKNHPIPFSNPQNRARATLDNSASIK